MSTRYRTLGLIFAVIVALLWWSSDPSNATMSPLPADGTGGESDLSRGRGIVKDLRNKADDATRATSAFKVMFVGDSITEGIAAASHPLRPLLPREGSCSYRFSLLHLLWSRHRIALDPVGPFLGVVGSNYPPERCTARLSGMGGSAGLARHNNVEYHRHAAIWGVTASEILGRDPNLHKKRQFARRFYFGKRAAGAVPADASRHLMTGAPSHLERWAAVYQPDVVVVLMGTNDLAQGAQVETLVVDRWPKMIRSILPAAQSLEDSSATASCSRILFLSTLLPRKQPVLQQLVEDVNAWAAHIHVCKDEGSRDYSGCVACVERSLPSKVFGTRTDRHGNVLDEPAVVRSLSSHVTQATLAAAAAAWCSPCVVVINVSDSRYIDSSPKYMYDGLHPAEAGEDAIANMMSLAIANRLRPNV